MPLKFGSHNLKDDTIEKRSDVVSGRVPPSVSHLVGTIARKNETTTSDIVYRAVVYYLSAREDLTDGEKEAVNVAIERVERNIEDDKPKELSRLMYVPGNLRRDAYRMKNQGFSNSYIVSEYLNPRIENVKKHKSININEILKMLEDLIKEFSGDSHED